MDGRRLVHGSIDVARLVIVAGVVALASGISGAAADPWSFGAVVGAFLGIIGGLGLAVHRRFGSALSAAPPVG